MEENKSSLEELLSSFIGETRARLNKNEAKIDRIEEQLSQMSSNMNARFKSLENQMGQLATAIGSQHQKGQLPSNMEINPREQRNMVNIVGSCVESQLERVASSDALELCLTNSCTSQGMFIDFDDEDLLDDVFVLDSTEEVPKREAKIQEIETTEQGKHTGHDVAAAMDGPWVKMERSMPQPMDVAAAMGHPWVSPTLSLLCLKFSLSRLNVSCFPSIFNTRS